MRIQFGAIVTAGAGKAGGTIIQRGRTGQILRNLTVPHSSKLQPSQAPRSALSAVSSNWRIITTSERIGWNSLAATLTRYNKFGVAYVPTGFQIFCEINLNLVNITKEKILTAAPSPAVFPDIQAWELTALPAGPAITLSWQNVLSDPDWVVAASFYPLQSMGATVPRGSARQVDAYESVGAESLDLSGEFVKRFGNPAGGVYQLAVSVIVMQQGTGWRMPDLILIVPFSTP